jgi:hypothetical protein
MSDAVAMIQRLMSNHGRKGRGLWLAWQLVDLLQILPQVSENGQAP